MKSGANQNGQGAAIQQELLDVTCAPIALASRLLNVQEKKGSTLNKNLQPSFGLVNILETIYRETDSKS